MDVHVINLSCHKRPFAQRNLSHFSVIK